MHKQTMKPTPALQPASIRDRRIGRKVLQADRLARALGASKHKKAGRTWRMPHLKPKLIAVICAITIAVSAFGYAGSQYYLAQKAATQKTAAAKQDAQLQAESVAADACRRKKAEQKADQIGKITYDELYDYGECEK